MAMTKVEWLAIVVGLVIGVSLPLHIYGQTPTSAPIPAKANGFGQGPYDYHIDCANANVK